MNQELIFWPIVAQMLLTLLLFVRLGMVKGRARAAGAVDLSASALDNDAWPDEVRKVANSIRNQFQLPVLLYVMALAFFALRAVDVYALGVAWLFVGSRVVHAYVHTSSNHVPTRTGVFKFGTVCVIGLFALLVRALLS